MAATNTQKSTSSSLRRTLVALCCGASAFSVVRVSSPRVAATRRGVAVRATSAEAESSKWMAEYLVRVHEARLEAVARARDEARAEALARIAELEVQLAALRGDAEPPKEAAPVEVAQVAAALEEPTKPVAAPIEPVASAVVAANPEYARRSSRLEILSRRWGAEEIERIEKDAVVVAPTNGVAANGATSSGDDAPTTAVSEAYAARVRDTKKLASRWGDEELSRIGA